MNLARILTIYRKELREALRDRRTLLSMIVIPSLIIPLLTFVVGRVGLRVVSQAREEVPAIAVLGGEDSPGVAERLRGARFRIEPSEGWRGRIADKTLRAAVLIPPGFEAGLKAGGAPAVTIYHHEGELKSGLAASGLETFFRELRERTVASLLADRSLPPTLARPFETRRENVAPAEKVGGNLFGGLVPYLIIILCFTGAMYPAIDLTAGEKERGTLETLLCSPVARTDIVLGKFLMVLTGSLSAMLFMLLSVGVTVLVGGQMLLAGGLGKAAATKAAAGGLPAGGVLPVIDPLGLLGVLAMVLPVAIFFAAVAFTIALFARSHREAQSYLAPLMGVVLLPAAVGMLPGLELNAGLALVPLLNLSLVCREMLSGVWHWSYIALIFGSSCAYAAGALWLAVRMFQREDVLFRS
jgi:sodium transport system permease protein